MSHEDPPGDLWLGVLGLAFLLDPLEETVYLVLRVPDRTRTPLETISGGTSRTLFSELPPGLRQF